MENSTFYGMQASLGTHEATKSDGNLQENKKRKSCGNEETFAGEDTSM